MDFQSPWDYIHFCYPKEAAKIPQNSKKPKPRLNEDAERTKVLGKKIKSKLTVNNFAFLSSWQGELHNVNNNSGFSMFSTQSPFPPSYPFPSSSLTSSFHSSQPVFILLFLPSFQHEVVGVASRSLALIINLLCGDSIYS